MAGAVVGAAAAGIGWAARDYRRWKALGPGGVPANPVGWLAVSGMRLRAREPYTWRQAGSGDVDRALLTLPPRAGERPEVGPYPVPHRVLTQHADQAQVAALQDVVEEFAGREGLEMRTSGWEKHHPALWRVGEGGRTAEIGHVHPGDGSMHVALSPLDARVVVARRWGEFHPLAGVMLGLPEGYVLLYSPRNETEIGHLRSILEAAAR
ncbi:hypothetical protein GCM10023215_37220 [Pseudonocardia yuanmonensis]|uniref:Luciferase domain-containing protein n=1 Tax=Pseudonocardia yuanmonensis TaxID=1095914 RepID=A0ABP8WVW9_9PSEU